ncbi:Senescence regulator [Heracleum sosnowskyi]|uniref:Senescence regulator n=1 Tax=Heracleum sosnowskyi TaxID=360622 RepID=A0AAD8N352_9APIA|nr:Senescence regulator [Heracleum sosnowskyi]
MATSKSLFKTPDHRFLPPSQSFPIIIDELDESEIWNYNSLASSPEFGVLSPRNKTTRRIDSGDAKGSTLSLPVNVPGWSKLVKQRDYNEFECEDEDEDEGDRVPPHEFISRRLAKRRSGCASFSMHEGVGRTLKGRDLSRVRNAIWEITGFQD